MQRAGCGHVLLDLGCVRKIGILTSAQPYVFMGDLDAVLDLDYREAPSGLSATIYPVSIETDMTDVGEGMVAWRPSSPGSSIPLIASLEQPLRLSPAPGLYVLSVGPPGRASQRETSSTDSSCRSRMAVVRRRHRRPPSSWRIGYGWHGSAGSRARTVASDTSVSRQWR